MRILPLAVLALVALTLTPARAQAPAPPANNPQAVSEEALRILRSVTLAEYGLDPDDVRAFLRLMVREKPPAGWREQRLAERLQLLTQCIAWTPLWGVLPQAPDLPPTDRATVTCPAPPLKLMLVPVEGQWKVDLDATYAALPQGLRETVEQRFCLRNLRKIVLNAKYYSSDNDSRLPDADKWVAELTPYLRDPGILWCPSAPELECGYAMNRALSGKNEMELKRPAEEVIFSDLDATRHRGGRNLAFADGHCKWSANWPAFPEGALVPGVVVPALRGPSPGAGGPPPGGE